MVKTRPDLGDAATLTDQLCELAGAALAPESVYRDRVEKRRKARWAQRHRHVLHRVILPMLHAQLDAELRAERRAEREAQREGWRSS